MRIPARLMPHGGLVQFEVLLGHGGKGETFAAPVVPDRACIQERRRLVRGTTSEIYSTATVWLDPEHSMSVGSKVTLWRGTARERQTTVLEMQYLEHGPALPAHVELLCR